MSTRDDTLARLRSAVGPAAPLPPLLIPGQSAEDPVSVFIERAAAVGMEVTQQAAERWVASLVQGLRSRGVRSAAVWDDPRLAPLATALKAEGIDVIPPEQHTRERLAGVDAGVTTAGYAIALSGTLVLDCDPQKPRSTSLLPPLHVAVLEASRIVPTLGHLFQRVGQPLPSALTFITGPSRTADIELTPVKGVHGPVEVIVYLLDS